MSLRSALLHTPLLAVILSLALYTASLRGGFVYDDRFTVVRRCSCFFTQGRCMGASPQLTNDQEGG